MSKKTERQYIQVGKHRFYDTEQWQIDYIRDHWAEKNVDIAKALEFTEKRVSHMGMVMELPKKATGYNASTGIDIGNHHFKNVTQEQFNYIKDHWTDQVSDIADAVGLDPRRVSEIIIQAGLRERLCVRFEPEDPQQYDEDLKNPYQSHVELGRKYGISESLIALHRKQREYGVRKKNYDTIPELMVAEVLDELDIVYHHPKQIDQWSIDFYLGQKMCIDVNGTWAHSLPHIIDRDDRKYVYLRERDYKYLIIEEAELKDMDKVKSTIINFVLGFPRP